MHTINNHQSTIENQSAHTNLNRSLSLMSLVFIGLAYMSPLAVFSPYGIVADATHGRVAGTYVVALFMILFTAYSYGKMVNAYPSSGSAYTYTQNTIGSHVGFMVGWIILLDYIFLPLLNVLAAGIFLHAAFPIIPIWLAIILFLSITTVVNIMGVEIGASINIFIVIFQFLVIIIFMILIIRQLLEGTSSVFLFEPIWNNQYPFSEILIGASIVCTSFLGFDAVTTFTEETIDPEKTVPKAIILVAIIGGALFIGVSYLMYFVQPDYTQFISLDAAGFEVVEIIGGSLLTALFTAGFFTASIGSLLASQASGARLLYVMGRDGVLPKRLFGYLSPKSGTPVINIFFIAAFCLISLIIDLSQAFSIVNFGALLAFTMVNISVIVHYFFKQKNRIVGTILYLIIPAIGACFNIWIWTNLDIHALIVGGIWTAIGFIYLLFLTKFFTQQPPKMKFKDVE